MDNNQCCKDNKCDLPRILSKEATNEILDGKLCFLIAIGTDGQAVRYLPHGVDIPANFFEQQGSDERIKLPPEDSICIFPVDTTPPSFTTCQNAIQYYCICPSAGGPRRC
jgi:hypothetical protein